MSYEISLFERCVALNTIKIIVIAICFGLILITKHFNLDFILNPSTSFFNYTELRG